MFASFQLVLNTFYNTIVVKASRIMFIANIVLNHILNHKNVNFNMCIDILKTIYI